MKLKLIPLLLLPALMLLVLVSCRGGNPLFTNGGNPLFTNGGNPLFTITDIERIGLTKIEDLWNISDGSVGPFEEEAWRGEIIVEGTSHKMDVVISPKIVEVSQKAWWNQMAPEWSCRRVISNVAIAVYYDDQTPKGTTEEACDWIIDNLR